MDLVRKAACKPISTCYIFHCDFQIKPQIFDGVLPQFKISLFYYVIVRN